MGQPAHHRQNAPQYILTKLREVSATWESWEVLLFASTHYILMNQSNEYIIQGCRDIYYRYLDLRVLARGRLFCTIHQSDNEAWSCFPSTAVQLLVKCPQLYPGWSKWLILLPSYEGQMVMLNFHSAISQLC